MASLDTITPDVLTINGETYLREAAIVAPAPPVTPPPAPALPGTTTVFIGYPVVDASQVVVTLPTERRADAYLDRDLDATFPATITIDGDIVHLNVTFRFTYVQRTAERVDPEHWEWTNPQFLTADLDPIHDGRPWFRAKKQAVKTYEALHILDAVPVPEAALTRKRDDLTMFAITELEHQRAKLVKRLIKHPDPRDES
jgi:hypothetical protein